MKTVNRVTLLGHLGKDPEVKALGSGTAVANFSIATTNRFKGKDGQWTESTDWHLCVAYARLAEIARDYLKKGSQVYVEGRLQTRSWDDKDGKKRYLTEVVLNEIVLLGSGGAKAQDSEPEPMATTGSEITDDDIPF